MADEKIFQRTIYPAYQWSPETIVKALFCFLDCLNSHQKAPHFFAAGIPVSSKRPRNQRGTTDSGTEDCVYRETSVQFDSPSQATGPIERRITEWSGHASLRGISQKTWLRNLIEEFKCNIFLTGRFNESFHKSIACWFPKEKIFIMRKNRV
jgi:hypothetical protein